MTAAGAGKRRAGKGRFLLVTGIDDIDRRLRELEPRFVKKQVRQAMRIGMKHIQKAVQANAPKPGVDPYATGATRKAVKVRAAKSKRRDRIGIVVKIGKGDYKGKEFYAAFREFGTSKQPARPIMKPAFTSEGPTARSLSIQALRTGVDAEVRALARK